MFGRPGAQRHRAHQRGTVEAGAAYRITVNSFLAHSGDGSAVLREGTNRTVRGLDIDAFAE